MVPISKRERTYWLTAALATFAVAAIYVLYSVHVGADPATALIANIVILIGAFFLLPAITGGIPEGNE